MVCSDFGTYSTAGFVSEAYRCVLHGQYTRDIPRSFLGEREQGLAALKLIC